VPLDHAACIAAIRQETGRFAELLEACDEDAPVAACPDWRVRDVAAHIGEVQRAWAWIVREGPVDRAPWDEVPRTSPGADLAGYVRAGGAELVDALEAAGSGKPVWTWWGEPATAGAVARHQVHEVALHRWDVEETGGGEPEPWSPEQAADGIDELLLVTLSVETNPWTAANGVLAIDPDDADEVWTVDCTGAVPSMRRGDPGTYDLRLLGPAADLQLLLWNRPRSFRYRGEPRMLTAFLAWPDLS
jgi:uncharacterized protein (TIGR03083 family)